MRTLPVLLVGFSTSIGLTACGGGGGAGSMGSGPLALQGKVVARDGSTSNLGGVSVGCVESGQTTTTGSTGRFALDAPTGVTLHLKVDDPTAPSAPASDPTSAELQGDEAAIDALDDGETCGVEIEIENGVIVAIRVTKDGGVDPHKEGGVGVLTPPTESDARGEIRVESDDGHSSLEVSVYALPEGSYSVEITSAAGEVATLGEIVSDGKEGELELVFKEGGATLPFGAASVAELAGDAARVLDAGGVAVLEGTVPDVGADEVKPDDDKNDDGKPDDGTSKDGGEKSDDGSSDDSNKTD